MQELINRLVASAGIDPALAENAVAIILGFIAREAPAEPAAHLFDSIPGSREMVDRQSGTGGSIAGMGAMGALNELTAAGLSFAQVQTVTREVIAFARDKAGEDTIGQIVGSIPGLEQFV